MTINDFGHKSFVTHTTGLVERIKKMPDKEYICLSNEETFTEDELHICPNCLTLICPTCGGEIQTIEEYDKAMLINAKES